jgi:hypothetical protein
MPKGPEEMKAAIIANLKSKTGRSLLEWIELLHREGPAGRKEREAWLKERGLGTVQARGVAR